jgi:hypothetical protein
VDGLKDFLSKTAVGELNWANSNRFLQNSSRIPTNSKNPSIE